MRLAATLLLGAAFVSVPGFLRADERSQQLVERLAEEAAAFERLAPQILGQETLVQRAEKPPRRFRILVGERAKTGEPEYQERKLVSEYAFSVFEQDKAIHEIRRVTSVDDRPVKRSKNETDDLAAIVTANNESRKRELLKQFEEYGLQGAATDFGQIILLFAPGRIEQYEFTYRRLLASGGERVLVFTYRQIDGPNRLTVVDARKDEARNLSLQGEVWVRESNFQPVRVTLVSTQTLGDNGIRQEAEVDYAMSPYGAVLPKSVHHRDMRGERVVAENTFSYGEFRRFGASSEIIFEAGPEQ